MIKQIIIENFEKNESYSKVIKNLCKEFLHPLLPILESNRNTLYIFGSRKGFGNFSKMYKDERGLSSYDS